MTLKEAVLKSLDDINSLANYKDIYKHILKQKYYDFGESKTPDLTVSGQLSNFIIKGDKRVKRIKNSKGSYNYYLTKNEFDVKLQVLSDPIEKDRNTYNERDLHPLLSSYLKNENIFAKTIFHEKSSSSKDNNQKWIHPDLVGVNFLQLQTNTSQTFLKVINKADIFKIISYELKREINSDYELKKSFFQAVSNSSWANYGYLVAFEISESLNDEMERLNQSFGIGIIELKSNPFESKVLYPSRFNDLDFKTIDKLCKINKDFENFIEQVEKLITASDKYIKSTEIELNNFCDDYMTNDAEIEKYCKEKRIPIEKADNTG